METNKIRRKTSIFFASLLILCASTMAVSAGIGTDDNHVGLSEVAMGSIIPVVTETGKISLSVDGLGTSSDTGTIQVQKPAGATVKNAYIAAATTGFFYSYVHLANGDIKINGNDVNGMTETPSSISSYNYWADVTSIVKPIVDAAPAGTIDLVIQEMNSAATDGEILVVVFDDPNQKTDNTIALLFGAQAVNGDTFSILTDPINKNDPNFALDMGLGISFGYQPSPQYSIVDVNDERLTTSAGGQDDGAPANGALLTVGGIGDSNDNPDPSAAPTDPRSDDELYSILPIIKQGDTKIKVFTQNPSNDDNIFFGYFNFKSATAVVGEGIILSPPSAVNLVGTTHTVVATIQDNNGNPVTGKAVTFKITSGPNAGQTGTATTDANGKATFSYTGNAVGTDTIVASYLNSHQTEMTSNQVTKVWTGTQVPEFPTMVLPVAAIMGLMFVFQRRKE